jgi:hypothetical protein
VHLQSSWGNRGVSDFKLRQGPILHIGENRVSPGQVARATLDQPRQAIERCSPPRAGPLGAGGSPDWSAVAVVGHTAAPSRSALPPVPVGAGTNRRCPLRVKLGGAVNDCAQPVYLQLRKNCYPAKPSRSGGAPEPETGAVDRRRIETPYKPLYAADVARKYRTGGGT